MVIMVVITTAEEIPMTLSSQASQNETSEPWTPSPGERFDIFGRPTEAWTGKTVRIVYIDSKGNITERVVEDIVFTKAKKNNALLLIGNGRLRQACRSFTVGSIMNLEVVL